MQEYPEGIGRHKYLIRPFDASARGEQAHESECPCHRIADREPEQG